MTIGSGIRAGTFCADAGSSLGFIRHLIHYFSYKYRIKAPAAFRFCARGFGLFHGTNIRFMTDRAAGGVNGVHKS
jgi:hypothetical protein